MSTGTSDDRVIRVSTVQNWTIGLGVFAKKALSGYRKGKQIASIDLRAVAGTWAHNHQNACAAYASVGPGRAACD